MGIWPISSIINYFGDLLFSGFVLVVDVGAIQLLNTQHQSVYNDASLKLKIIAHDKGIESDEFKNAREVAKISMSKFTRVNT